MIIQIKEGIPMKGKRFNPEKAGKLMSAKRKQSLPPDQIIRNLDLKENDVVADLGAGVGYFSIPIAQKTNNTVYAIDIELEMLKMLKDNAAREHISNIQSLVSDLENIQLEDKSVDKVIVAFVLHEVPDLDKAIQEIQRILKPHGKALIIEWEAIETESGPPLHHRLPSQELVEMAKKYGFNARLFFPNEENYAIVANG